MVFINGGFQIIQPSFSMFFGFSINQKPSSCWGTPIPDGWASAVAQSLDGSYSNIDYKIIQNLFPQIFHFDSMAIWDMVIRGYANPRYGTVYQNGKVTAWSMFHIP